MIESDIDFFKRKNTGTSPTNNQMFDEQGYLFLKNFVDVTTYKEDIPKERGQLHYRGTRMIKHVPIEDQVNGSISRYNFYGYRELQGIVGKKISEVIGSEIYPTYYFDRFYFIGQELKNHVDRDSCEISLTLCLDYNCGYQWPIMIESVGGKVSSIQMSPGDAVLYKGCERPHWREPLEDRRTLGEKIKTITKKPLIFHHQIFFHYVLANGIRAHFAFDRGNEL